MPNRSPLRLGVTGAVCLVAGIALANGTRFLPQFSNPLIDSAALIAGVLIGLAGAMTLIVAAILALANAR
jgi:hypothetical protein